ncbi:SDR family NAD(P)-dependent oxidoreductase [Methylobrevis pamukkalensis]|uniref:NADP-dependent 3-hydroxy acid dehydrogenase YdfG n=1 Tax=Methylobrevis pamukkalensis TaxID=1439726 RepID=A0A1E3H6R1_9HYPH|nr:SDR family oxidoreductase [Methylobrevis pamukkalensis]ODN72017.1 putative oxidoreductase [Methylobrevis pamukkalensis]
MSTSANSLGTALVTGASSGIGAVYADRLAHRGYDLLLVARNGERLAALADRLSAETGVKAEVLTADLSSRADLGRVEQRLRDDAAITMIVNNAGFGEMDGLLQSDTGALDSMIDVNVVAVNRLAVAAAQTFAPRGSGAIINIASVVALIPERVHGTYSATKAFVLTLTQAIHANVAERGVKVQAVMPGVTRTAFFERAGGSVDALPPEMVMDVNDLVDAALAGFDQGELVTIPSLPDAGEWETLTQARAAMAPNLSLRTPAARYLHRG